MRRVFWFRPSRRESAEANTWHLSSAQRDELQRMLSEIGLHIVHEARGPVPLLNFGRRMLDRLGTASSEVPLFHFADALKRVIRDMRHDCLRVMSPTEMLGVGYVYNAADPETWPVRTSR